ncbi:hypothetical protein ACGFY9_39870 [Streptomyces sp. NPDC048504]|uniref:hypothetical protein n=1 Tax=Streptomyces sp. NPDC048504 TaxID=3365559 RepID=UPI0037200B5A
MSADLLASEVIPPSDPGRIVVGEYETEELIPELDIADDADGYDLVTWVRHDQRMADGSIRVVLLVQNYSSQPVTVYVRRKPDDR